MSSTEQPQVRNDPRRNVLRVGRFAPIVLLGAWIVIAAVLLAQAWRDVGAGVDGLRRGRTEFGPADLASPEPERVLRSAASRFSAAEGRLNSPVLLPLRVMPVAGRQLASVRSMASTAASLSETGAEVASSVRAAAGRAAASEQARVDAIAEIASAVEDALRTIRAADLGPTEALLPPVAERRNRLAIQLAEAEDALEDAQSVTRAVEVVLRGPHRMLLLAANNAEMRAGSGMFLQAGVLTIENGAIHLSDLRPTHDLTLETAVAIEGDLGERWSFTELGREWRNLGFSPRFPPTADAAARMWHAATGETVDGVIAVDVIAVANLLEATGPVDIAGHTVDAGGAADFLLHDQYLEIPTGGIRERDRQRERRDRLGDLADALVTRLGGDVDTAAVADAMATALRGRHLLLWSDEPRLQAAWERSALGGTLTDRSMLLAVSNRGGNKLDPFLQVDATVAIDDGRVEVTAVIDNRTPEDEPLYIAGPAEGFDVAPGTYTGFVSLNVPGAATDLRVDGGPMIVAGADGPTRVAATQIVLPAGGETTITFSFALPDVEGVVVEPSARVPPVRWHFGERTFTDRVRRTLRR